MFDLNNRTGEGDSKIDKRDDIKAFMQAFLTTGMPAVVPSDDENSDIKSDVRAFLHTRDDEKLSADSEDDGDFKQGMLKIVRGDVPISRMSDDEEAEYDSDIKSDIHAFVHTEDNEELSADSEDDVEAVMSDTKTFKYSSSDRDGNKAYHQALDFIKRHELTFLENRVPVRDVSYWNGRYWELLHEEKLQQMIYDQLTAEDKERANSIASNLKNIAAYVLHEVRRRQNEDGSRFTQDDWVKASTRVVFRDGTVYDVMTGKTHSSKPKYPYEYAINCEYIEGTESTPVYDSLRENATGGDLESMALFDYTVGYLVLPTRNGKCFFVLAYAPDSGKSIFGSFVENIFEYDQVKKTRLDKVSENFEMAGINRVRLLTCFEADGRKMAAGVVTELKNLSGEEVIRMRAMRRNPVSVETKFKMLFGSNYGFYPPAGTEVDQAFYRRIRILPFVQSVPESERDGEMQTKLMAERDYIVSNALRRYSAYVRKHGITCFPESDLSKEIKKSWMNLDSFHEEVLRDLIEYSGDDGDRIAKCDLVHVYRQRVNEANDKGGEHVLLMNKDLFSLVEKVFPSCVMGDGVKTRHVLLSECKSPVHAIGRLRWKESVSPSPHMATVMHKGKY